MRVETDEPEIVERISALVVGKAEVVCCVRVPGPGAQRMQEVRTVSTMTSALLGPGDWLAELEVSRVVMEATSDYWRAPFHLLEDRFETWLVNAHDVKHGWMRSLHRWSSRLGVVRSDGGQNDRAACPRGLQRIV